MQAVDANSRGIGRANALVYTILGMLIAAAGGWYAAARGVTYREVIVGGVLVILAVLIGLGDKGVRWGAMGWVLTMAIGYRAITVTENLLICPAEILIWCLAVWLVLFRRRAALNIPGWIYVLGIFWLWAWVPGIHYGRAYDVMLAEFRNWLLMIPVFLVLYTVLSDSANWRLMAVFLYLVGVWIALLGVVEYYFPGVRQAFPGFIGTLLPVTAEGGFVRAEFSFWGGPQATFICVLVLPFALVLWHWHRGILARFLIASSGVLVLLAIYDGGYRSMWLTVAIELFLATILSRRYWIAIAVIAIGLMGYGLLPEAAQWRVNSLVQIFRGHPIETSGVKRETRAQNAFKMAVEHPAGEGWAASGWVHSDFLQVAANQGVIAGLLFLGCYVWSLARLWRRTAVRYARGEPAAMGLALVLAFVAAGGLLAAQGAEVLPQLVLPVWAIWAMVEAWLLQEPHLGGA